MTGGWRLNWIVVLTRLLLVGGSVQAQMLDASLKPTAGADCPQPLPATDPLHLRLERLLGYLLQTNRSQLRDDLHRKSICLVLESGDDSTAHLPWANSEPDRGRISLSTGLLAVLETDAELAFILSHELAHLWLRHPLFGGVPDPIQRVAAWQSQDRQCQALHRQLRLQVWAQEDRSLQALTHLPQRSKSQEQHRQTLLQAQQRRQRAHDHWLSCLEQQQKLGDRLLGEAGAIHNWTEAEADAVGLDLFLNAGFDPVVLPDLFRRTKDMVPQDCPTQPKRGEASHPTPCWRLWTLQQRLRTPRAIAAQNRAIARQGQLWRMLPLTAQPTRPITRD